MEKQILNLENIINDLKAKHADAVSEISDELARAKEKELERLKESERELIQHNNSQEKQKDLENSYSHMIQGYEDKIKV